MEEFLPSAGLSPPHLLFLDNSILQDLEKRDIDSTSALRAYAFELFADFIVNHANLQSALVVTPVSFYEFCGRKIPANAQEWKALADRIHRCLSCVTLHIDSFGSEEYGRAKAIFEDIADDAARLAHEVKEIKRADWAMPLRDGTRTLIPFTFALRAMKGKLRLRYFHAPTAEFILAALVERLILDHKGNDQEVTRKFRDGKVYPLASISKIKNDVLQGLGDIELYQYCDVSSQYRRKQGQTYTALTFDKNLALSLANRTTLVATHEPIVGGSDSKARIQEKIDDLKGEFIRLRAAKEREDSVRRRAAMHIEVLKPILC
jgi:hypothetical protein